MSRLLSLDNPARSEALFRLLKSAFSLCRVRKTRRMRHFARRLRSVDGR